MAKKQKGALWLDDTLVRSIYPFGLCITEEQFWQEVKKLNAPKELFDEGWLGDTALARLHTITKPDKRMCRIVCIDDTKLTSMGVIEMLIHEGTHIWQGVRDDMGEENPSEEFEAYSVQWIVTSLIAGYSKLKDAEKAKKNANKKAKGQAKKKKEKAI